MEDLYWKDEMDPEFGVCNLVKPEHFQGIFAFMGILYSVGLIAILWDLLINPSYKFCSLMIAGLVSCLLVTITNLILFSSVLVTPITYESYNPNKIKQTHLSNPYAEIFNGEFELTFDKYKNNEIVALAIVGYGAVTSFIFIFIAMIRSLGKRRWFNWQVPVQVSSTPGPNLVKKGLSQGFIENKFSLNVSFQKYKTKIDWWFAQNLVFTN